MGLDWLERAWGRLAGAAGQVAWLLLLGVLIYGAAQLLFSAAEPADTRSGKILALLNDNWKAALLVALIPFYRTIRLLIGRIREISAGGVTMKMAGSQEEVDLAERRS